MNAKLSLKDIKISTCPKCDYDQKALKCYEGYKCPKILEIEKILEVTFE